MLQTLQKTIQTDPVLPVAWLLAFLTMFLVPPDAHYLEYLDLHTLGLLFSLMTVMAGFQQLGLFRRMGEWMLSKTSTTRQLEAVLLSLPFFSSMLVTNDVALITFVPFALEVLAMAHQQHRVIPVVAMQTVAANLGSMTTPIGNPQNLYLYSHYALTFGRFFQTMLPFTLGSAVLILLFLALRQSQPLQLPTFAAPTSNDRQNFKLLYLYSLLFLVCLAAVANWLPVWLAVTAALLSSLCWNRSVLNEVDYTLLLTFTGFFLFVGNLGRLDAFRTLFQGWMEGREILCGVLVSQVISNVPAALLLSGFTQNGTALLIGVNLGGLGTLIASMASLISYKYISRAYPTLSRRYLGWFTGINLLFLFLLSGLLLIL